MPQLPYVTLDVFTTTPLSSGNPLAIVTIPAGTTISKSQEHLIAREFGYSETVFIYPLDPSKSYTKIAIWTVRQEIPFAGHPTVGTGWYLSEIIGGERYNKDTFELLIPAGILTVGKKGPGKIKLDTPHAITVWERHIPRSRVAEVISVPYEYFENDDEKIFSINHIDSTKTEIPVISIVDGMSFALVQVQSVSILQALAPGKKGCVLDMVTDVQATVPPGGKSFIAVYCYAITDQKIDGKKGKVEIRTRCFFNGDGEDPATGSAACALGSYLAIKKGGVEKGVDEWEFEFTQGVEMGRRSDIGVTVLLEEAKEEERRVVKKVFLEGNAAKVMEGTLTV